MNLIGKSTILRALEPEDLEFLYEIENNTQYWHLSQTAAPYSRFALKQYIKRSLSEDIYALRELRLIICTKQDQTPIGIIDLFDFDPYHKRSGVGIIIHEQHQQQGFGADALKTLINYCFDVLHLNQIYCNILSDNQKSIQLFLNQNFKECGRKINWHFNGKNYQDELLLQRFRD